MIIDCSTLATGTTIDADICVIGAGPAGLTVALELDGTDHRVAVLESGLGPGRPLGLEPLRLTATESDFGVPNQPRRRFGGAANEWIVRLPWMRRGVRMVPLAAFDFESRPWIAHSGWPFGWDTIEPYYRAAQEFLRLGQGGFDVGEWEDGLDNRLPIESFGFTTSIERFCPSRVFTTEAYSRIVASSNVTLYRGAPVGEITGTADLVDGVQIDSGTRSRLHATARTFVLALGGIENARQLLLARGGAGYGNAYDNVGRYYMDHHRLVCGDFKPTDRTIFDRAGLYSLRAHHGVLVSGKLTPTRELLTEHHLLHSAAALMPKPCPSARAGIDELRALANSMAHRKLPKTRPSVRRIAAGGSYIVSTAAGMSLRQRRFPPHTDAGWASRRGSRRFGSFEVELQVEQAPDPSNRVSLGVARDTYGRTLPDLRWRWSPLDLHSVKRTTDLLDQAFRRSGLGSVDVRGWIDQPELTTPQGASHPMGATRTHASPRRGVVDADCRVHGVRNLFVAGSSVFPTGGYANPTFTIVALGLRLAARVRRDR